MKGHNMSNDEQTTVEIEFVSDTQEHREDFRQAIVEANAEYDIRPVDFDILRECVVEKHKDDLEDCLKTGKEGVIRCNVTYNLLRALIMANGANRLRTDSHCEGLAADFRKAFRSSMTHVVISKAGLMQDGGHSTYAAGVAFFPLQLFNDIYTHEVERTNEEGETETVTETIYPTVSKDFDENQGGLNVVVDEQGNRVYEDLEGAEELAKAHRDNYDDDEFQFNVIVNSPADVCRKLAERRLNIGVKEYLEMVPQIRKFMRESGIDADTWEQVVKAWKLRTDCKVIHEGTDKEAISYGKLNKGGRPNNAEAPAWLLAFAPMAHDALTIMCGETTGRISLHSKIAAGLPIKDVIVAMCCLDVEGMQRLWDALTSDHDKARAYAKHLEPHVIKDTNDPEWRKKPAWWIVSSLIAYGRGKSPEKATSLPLHVDAETVHPQQDPDLRAPGWDSFEYDVIAIDEESINDDNPEGIIEGELREDVLLSGGEVVGKLIGNAEEMAKSLGRKKKAASKSTASKKPSTRKKKQKVA